MAINHNAYLRMVLIDEIIAHHRLERDEFIHTLNLKLEGYGQKRVCESSVDKDIRRMKDNFNAPIENIGGKYCYTKKGYRFNSIHLDREEIQTLDFLINFISSRKGLPIRETAVSILERLFFKATDREHIGGTVEMSEEEAGPGNQWLVDIHNCITARKPITVTYHTEFGNTKKVKMSPGKLVERAGDWLVKGYDHGCEKEAEIPLDLISEMGICVGLNYRPLDEYETVVIECSKAMQEQYEKIRLPKRKGYRSALPGRNRRSSVAAQKTAKKINFPFMDFVLN